MARRSAIGLDIGTSGVRAAELSFGKGAVTLEKFGQVALPEGAVRDGEVVNSDAAVRPRRSESTVVTGALLLGTMAPGSEQDTYPWATWPARSG